MCIIPKEVLYISQIFGCFPLKMAKSRRGYSRLVFSSKIFLCGVLFYLFLTIITYTALGLYLKQILSDDPICIYNKVNAIAITIDAFFLHLMIVILFISSSWKHQTFIKMCNILEETDKFLLYKYDKRKIKTKTVLIFIYNAVIFSCILMLSKVSFFRKNHQIICIFDTVPAFLYFAQTSFFIQFSFVAECIAERFDLVNRNFKQRINRRNFRSFLETQEFRQDNFDSSDAASTAASIKSLSDTYWQLCEAVRQADSFYSNQLFFAVLSAFVHIIINLYFFFINLIVLVPTLQRMSIMGSMLLTQVILLVHLVRSATTVTNAADKTAPTICRLVNEVLDPEIRKQLDIFLLQLIHHSVVFTGNGLYHINNSMLTSIAGSVTTYLVILIQYRHQTSQSQNEVSSMPYLNFNNVSSIS